MRVGARRKTRSYSVCENISLFPRGWMLWKYTWWLFIMFGLCRWRFNNSPFWQWTKVENNPYSAAHSGDRLSIGVVTCVKHVRTLRLGIDFYYLRFIWWRMSDYLFMHPSHFPFHPNQLSTRLICGSNSKKDHLFFKILRTKILIVRTILNV